LEHQRIRVFLALFFLLGCARVNLTSKDPIKLDVTMRLDIYQHVANDANAIEDMIASPKEEKGTTLGKTSWLVWGLQEAYAQEEANFPAGVQAAIDARKERRPELLRWESRGAVGENAKGYVEIRDESAADVTVASLVSEENKDRALIYDYVSNKNGTTSSETGKVFAKRIQSDAPGGTPVESAGGSWSQK
jgi:uncharacterized protein YdbL (DUF1318 family)